MLHNFFLLVIFALAATVIPSSHAHGFLASVTIDGKQYKGNIPNANPDPSPIRQIDSVNPIMPSNNTDMSCGANAKPAELVVSAKPGSQLMFDWHSGENTDWPHNIGPMFTYMASCGNTTCDKFDSHDAKWFKIQEDGRVNGNSTEWLQDRLFHGQQANATVPEHIPPGQYLVRHEIIGLHNAVTLGLAEFYPSCTQIQIEANNSTVIQPNETVAFPGAYSDDDPGIHIDVFGPPAPYPFPGPKLSNVVTDDDTNGPAGTGSTTSAPTTTGSNSTSSTSKSKSGSSKTCLRPRKVSRVMARYIRSETKGLRVVH